MISRTVRVRRRSGIVWNGGDGVSLTVCMTEPRRQCRGIAQDAYDRILSLALKSAVDAGRIAKCACDRTGIWILMRHAMDPVRPARDVVKIQ